MNVCLDTNAYSRLMIGHAPLTELLETADEIAIPATVLGELHAGFEQGARRAENRRALAEFLRLPGVATLPITGEIAERYGILVGQLARAGTPIPTNDIWIAAAALEIGARLVSYDTHFSAIPWLTVLAP